MPNANAKGQEAIETTRVSGSGNLDPSAPITVTVSELVAVEDVLNVSVAVNSASTDSVVAVTSVSTSGNDVTLDFQDEGGAANDADALEELIVTVRGF